MTHHAADDRDADRDADETPTPLELAAAASLRQRLGAAPPAVTGQAVHAFWAAQGPAWGPARVLLVVTALLALLIEVPVLLGSATHTGQDVAVLHVAMAVGFALAAWRPTRYAAALTPVAAAAAVLLALPVATTGSGRVDGLGELAHLPLLVGAALLLFTARPQGIAHRSA